MITQRALALGFDLVGYTHADRFAVEGEALEQWVEAGFNGSMRWMQNTERRQDPQSVLPGAQGIVVVGMSYYDGTPNRPLKAKTHGRIARYSRGRDYHKTMEKRLKQLSSAIREAAGPETQTRYYVDTGPVLERAAAKRAGLGFIGKNTLFINPRFGSWLFLGEIITNIAFSESPSSEFPDCGSCQLCIDACPTDAIVEPFKLDARRCISYLTIEERGDIEPELRSRMGEWLFGCDICQEVCPFNETAEQASSGLEDLDSAEGLDLTALLQLKTQEEFRARFRARPLLRAKREGLLRNAAIAAGNSGESKHTPWLMQAAKQESPLVRRHAKWALQALGAAE